MKIKLSRSQWERIGRTAGWMKKASESLTIYEIEDRSNYEEPRFRLKPMDGYKATDVEIDASFGGFKEDYYEPSEPAGFEISRVTICETGENITEFLDLEELNKVLMEYRQSKIDDDQYERYRARMDEERP